MRKTRVVIGSAFLFFIMALVQIVQAEEKNKGMI